MTVPNYFNIELDGKGYRIGKHPRYHKLLYQRSQAIPFVGKFGSGDPTYRDSSFWSHWVQVNWQNGAKSDFFNDQARFFYDENVNIHEDGRITLSPNIEDAGTNASANTVCAMTDSSWGISDYRLWTGGSLGDLWEWDNTNSWTFKYQVGFTPITDMIGYDSSIWVGTSGGRVYRVSANGTFQSSSNPGNSYVSQLVTSDITGTTLVYMATQNSVSPGGTITALSNVSTGTIVWNPAYSKITAIAKYLNRLVFAAGAPLGDFTALYGGNLAVYDGVSVTHLVSISHTLPTTMAVFDNLLFVGTSHGHLYVYNGASFDLLFKFWGNDIDMEIKKLWVHQDKLFVLVSKNSSLKNSDITYAGVWTFNRRGLNLEFKNDDAATSAYYEIFTFKNQLLYSYGEAGKVTKTNENTFVTSGSLQSSYFDANLPSLNKLFKETTVIYDWLSSGTSASIAYKTDESNSSWTTYGNITTVSSTSATFQLPSALIDKKLSYQLTLSSNTVSSTPRIKKVITRYEPTPDFYHSWNFAVDTSEKIQLQDGTYEASTGLQLEAQLFSTARKRQLVNFKDIDYASSTLNGSLAASALTINVADATSFPPFGRLRIPSTGEEILVSSRTSTTLTLKQRGYKGTTATSAANGAGIDMSYMVFVQNTDENNFLSLNQLPGGGIDHYTPVTLLET